uniref:Glutaredoxin domain-containing protein n=1 Tax=Buteo japonicus TaxID=224669 RepID=A0A8B9YWH8_9AVES
SVLPGRSFQGGSMADNFLQSKIEDGKVTVFVRGGCPYSRNAVDVLKQYDFAPGRLQVFDIDASRDAQDYFQATGSRTPFPPYQSSAFRSL